jgi:hypothetical protein
MVPYKYEQDKSLGLWVHTQRKHNNKYTLLRDRKELLDQIGFVWNARARAVRSATSTSDVRILVIGSLHPLERSCCSLSFFFFFSVV